MDKMMQALGELEVDLSQRVSAALERGKYTKDDLEWIAAVIDKIGGLPFGYRTVMLLGLKLSGLDDQIQIQLRGLEQYAAHDMNGDPDQADAQRLTTGLRRTWDLMCGRG